MPLNNDGIMVILSSPSGAGKTSISRRLLAGENELELSVSATTRKRRHGEVQGKDYHFVSKDVFHLMINMSCFYSFLPVLWSRKSVRLQLPLLMLGSGLTKAVTLMVMAILTPFCSSTLR